MLQQLLLSTIIFFHLTTFQFCMLIVILGNVQAMLTKMQPFTQGRASNPKHHWLYPSSILSLGPWQHNYQPWHAINGSRIATWFFYQDSLPIKNNMYPRKGCKCIEKRGKHVVKLLKSSMIKACECDQSLIITRIKQGNKWWPFWRLESSIWNPVIMVPHPIIIQHFLERIVLFLLFSFCRRRKYKVNLMVI